VFVLPYEAMYLIKYCDNKFDHNLYAALREQIIEKDAVTSSMTADRFLNYTKPCPFLINKECGVYEARPMACKLFLSMSAASCEEERNYPSDFLKYARLYEMPLHIGRTVNEGISAYLLEKGLKPMEWILESSVRILLTVEDAKNKWFQGENIFQPREIGKEEWDYLKRFDLT
jgi:Fe-S-cluster containining protein